VTSSTVTDVAVDTSINTANTTPVIETVTTIPSDTIPAPEGVAPIVEPVPTIDIQTPPETPPVSEENIQPAPANEAVTSS